MTNRERELLDLLKENPMISQKEIAEKLNIQRSSVAAHILNLTKKGLIKGKGYILSEEAYVIIIGGAGMDITGFPNQRLKLNDSNPGSMKLSMGGVGRNIGENLARLEVPVKMLTAIGTDVYGDSLVEQCERLNMDFSSALKLTGESTATYMAIMDDEGDMKVALSNMGIIEKITVDYIRKHEKLIRQAAVIVVDTNLNQEVIEYVAETFKDRPIFVDPVSTAKAEKLKRVIGCFHTVKPNLIEASQLTGLTGTTPAECEAIKRWFIEQGVSSVYMSLGKEGVLYGDSKQTSRFVPKPLNIVNATGAGDAFMAGLVYGYMQDWGQEDTVKFASAMSAMAIMSEETINPNITLSKVMEMEA